jgi:DNA-binding CsgD family transcriptional regulator
MSASVNDVLSAQSAVAAENPPTPVHPAAATPAPGFVLSTADLSESARALSLHQQGQTPSEIAQSLGISLAIVDGYLGIVVPTVATASAQASPATQSPSAPAKA